MRWLIVAALAAILTIGTITIGIASSGSPDEIRLVLDHGTSEFQYGSERQKIRTGHNQCNANPDKYGAGLVTVETGAYSWHHKPVDGKLGLVNGGLGVSATGYWWEIACGKIDYWGSGKSESISFGVGPAINNQVFTYVDFDLSAKHDSRVRFDFYQGDTIVGTQITDLESSARHSESNKGHDWHHDKYRVLAFPTAPDGPPTMTPPETIVPFDRIVVSAAKGAVSVEGGSNWGKEYNNSDKGRPTVFHLTTSIAEISVDASVLGYPDDDLGFVEAGTTLDWKYAVTNTGDLPLTNINVIDSTGLTISGPSGDDGDNILSAAETWYYTASSPAVMSAPGGGGETHEITATGQSADDGVSATDEITYFGMSASIEMDKTTEGSDDGGVYSGPGDDVLINAGDTVTWTYHVTNTGNVPLTISVEDNPEGSASCPSGSLAPGASVDCSLTATADESPGEALADGTYEDGYSNSAIATGTHGPTETSVESTSDESGYFGMNRSLFIEVTNNGVGTPPVVSDPEVVWTVFARNDGNVEVEVIVAEENVPDGASPNQCDIAESLLPGESDSCEIRTPAVDGEQTTTFTVRGEDPLGMVIEETSGTVGYYGGLACGESAESGGPDLTDTPLAGFFVGPSTKDDSTDCAVAVDIVTENDPEEPEQSVFLGAPVGYSWVGVTGLLTIEWDIEDPADGLRPTLQTNGLVTEEVPVCAGDVAVEIAEPAPGDFMYTLIDNPVGDGSYPNATGGGDVCLVLHTTRTINYDNGGTPEVKTLTTEVFYIFNDPRLSRPR